tara:strand:- start:14523 stop:14903 length:381 start_codon:yes stop_codon:yes gene_type:complete
MTIFYSNVQNNRNNSLYSYNPSLVTGSNFGIESRFQKNENETQNPNIKTRNPNIKTQNPNISPDNKPHSGINKSKHYNPLSNTLKTIYENEIKRHSIIIKRLDKIENFMLLILIVLALIAFKLYQK